MKVLDLTFEYVLTLLIHSLRIINHKRCQDEKEAK